MKKILVALMLCLVSVMSFGQLSELKKSNHLTLVCAGHPFGVGFNDLYYAVDLDSYYLVVSSTNAFESKKAVIYLGNKEQTISILNYLVVTIKPNNINNYELDGYTLTGYGYLPNFGKLEDTIGTYQIQPTYIKKIIKKLRTI